MKELKLHDGELNIMELLWSNKTLAAKDMAKIIKEYVGWEKNTTYTVIKRLIGKYYDGSLETFIADYLRNKDLSATEVDLLEKVVHEQKV